MHVSLFAENLYVLDDGNVRQFLIVSDENAILIDTGFKDSHIYEEVRKITTAPITVLMTHGDGDHAGGLDAFGECYLHEGDWHLVKDNIKKHALHEGDIFKCGEYCLEVIEIPGHTYGSVAFFDKKKKLMFPGDSVQKIGPIYMFGNHRNLDLYIESQKKLCEYIDKVDTILPCHNEYPIAPDYIEKNLNDAILLKEGKLKGEKHEFLPCFTYTGEYTKFYY